MCRVIKRLSIWRLLVCKVEKYHMIHLWELSTLEVFVYSEVNFKLFDFHLLPFNSTIIHPQLILWRKICKTWWRIAFSRVRKKYVGDSTVKNLMSSMMLIYKYFSFYIICHLIKKPNSHPNTLLETFKKQGDQQ